MFHFGLPVNSCLLRGGPQAQCLCSLYCSNNQLSPFSCYQPLIERQLYQDYIMMLLMVNLKYFIEAGILVSQLTQKHHLVPCHVCGESFLKGIVLNLSELFSVQSFECKELHRVLINTLQELSQVIFCPCKTCDIFKAQIGWKRVNYVRCQANNVLGH